MSPTSTSGSSPSVAKKRIFRALRTALRVLAPGRLRSGRKSSSRRIHVAEVPALYSPVSLVGSFSEVHMQDATAGGSRRRSGICYRIDGGPRVRLPNTAHASRPWRIHEIARNFRLEDVWALPTPGGPHDFPRLVRQVAAGDPSRSWSGAARALWALRWKVGQLLGWDRPDAGLGSRVPTLRDRLPADLRDAPS